MNWLLKRVNSLNLIKNSVFLVLFFIILSFNISAVLFPNAFSKEVQIFLAASSSIISIVAIAIGYSALNRYSKEIKKIREVADNAAQGSMYHRITHIDKSEEIGALAWDINDMLDQFEVFTRDLESSLEMISQGKTHRKMMPSGLKGDFVKFSNNINKALERIATAHSKDQFIQDMLKIVKEYQNNDYRNKIDTTGMQEDIIGLAKGINDLGSSLSELSLMNLHNGLALQKGANVLTKNVAIINAAASEQAASLEETASALEEITSNIRNSNANTVKMEQYAKGVTDSANLGKELANQTAASMDDINTQVTAINEAITVIDQIAFQTNILSLNAAVEAATAGEAGKGFAVVAGEVRNLASRSAEAAKEIKELVESATSKANDGKHIADDMIAGYGKLNENIEHTLELIEDVARASKEQEIGIVQINESVTLLDKKTNESVKIAQETNIVAQQSNDIAQKIVEDAKKKEVIGKEKVHIREKLIDLNYNGPERRKIERDLRNGR